MRFFTNESRSDREDQFDGYPHHEQPGRVQSEPIAMPLQRPPSSPWVVSPRELSDPATERVVVDVSATQVAFPDDQVPAEQAHGEAGRDTESKDERVLIDENTCENPKALRDHGPFGTMVAASASRVFADADADSLRDRWRDLQLRFVDDPKAITDEAAALVDEAVNVLAATLRKQTSRLAEDPDGSSLETEVLRVRLRGYRDFLNRLLSLR